MDWKTVLQAFQTDDLYTALRSLFKHLNIPLNRIDEHPITPHKLLVNANFESEPFALMESVYIAGMVDDAVIKGRLGKSRAELDGMKNSDKEYPGILVFGAVLKKRDNKLPPTRTQLAKIAREFNREYKAMPVAVLFLYECQNRKYIALCSVERGAYLQDWREGEKIGKVSCLRDVDVGKPHAGHVQILTELQLPESGVASFEDLYKHWREVFDVTLLNQRFYSEVSNWYFRAVNQVEFPRDGENRDAAIVNAEHVIRLLTRLIFIWFLKEKGLVPHLLFDEAELKRLLKNFGQGHVYYRAVLQNLFFGTLNQKITHRKFAQDGDFYKNKKEYGVKALFRYAGDFTMSTDRVLKLFESVPFLNGGLFDCLDRLDENGKVVYRDGFSRNPKKQARVPDALFFDAENRDLSVEYGNSSMESVQVRGLIQILKDYKFTVSENTPLEEDVALDPELLGKVFENLLASYNPETRTTARNLSGSFYTPREIVDYMVEESLMAFLKGVLSTGGGDAREEDLKKLLSAGEDQPFIDTSENSLLVNALSRITIFDPACGSGAFPMGILHKLVHVLTKLDPDNRHWKQLQQNRAGESAKDAYGVENEEERRRILNEIEQVFNESVNHPDYARKLYLIENAIFGADIQSIAVQISKLRFFISLIVEQKSTESSADNYGIRALPNLETKFVTADTLVALDESVGRIQFYPEVQDLERDIRNLRHRYFTVTTRREKLELQQQDREKRLKLKDRLKGKMDEEWEQAQKGMEQELYHLEQRHQYVPTKEKKSIEQQMQSLQKRLQSHKIAKNEFNSAEMLSEWDPYDPGSVSPFFDSMWMYGQKDGFDIVLGNPPYIQLQKNGGKLATLYKGEGFETFASTGDIYCLFYERGVDLLMDSGCLCYITSNKWMRAGYGKKLRDYFLKHGQVDTLLDMGGQKVFDATVDPCIVLYKKRSPIP